MHHAALLHCQFFLLHQTFLEIHAATALKRPPVSTSGFLSFSFTTMLKYAMTLTLGMLGPLGAWAAHGLDNNWTVKVIGMKDANGCMQATSIEDLGSNLVRPDSVSCLSATQMCTDDYQCVEARALKPSTFQGCSFDASSGVEAEVTGVLMDGLCYQNFVVDQKNYNGGAGLAPDKVHVRSEAHLHTRACLVVSYCAKTGFYLLQRPSSTADYSYAAQMDSQAAEKVFDFLIDARHPCGTTSTTEMIVSNAAIAPFAPVLTASAMILVALSWD